MKRLSTLALFAAALVFTGCTPSSGDAPRSSGSYSTGNPGGSYFKRSADDSWQDRTFRPGGY